MTISRRILFLVVFDVMATYASYYLASLLTDQLHSVFETNEIYFILAILALINIASFALFRLYNTLWEYASVDELIKIALVVVLQTLIGASFLWLVGVRLPIRVFFSACIIMIFFIGGVRFLFRIVPKQRRALSLNSPCKDRPRTLIVGAGETGSLAIARMASKDPHMPGIPIVATDDDPAKKGQRIHGIKVMGSNEDIVNLVKRYDIEQIVVAIPSASFENRKRIYSICTQTDCRLRTLPNVRELTLEEIGNVSLRDVNVADLLGRDEVMLNTRSISGYVAGQTVLVTGGGGSIGSELCRQLCKVAPARVIIFDIYENDAYMLKNELEKQYDDVEILVEIGSVCDKRRIEDIFLVFKPDLVFHAAAHKHVPLMERCPREAIQNNVFGTLNVVVASDRHQVKRFIFVSTDKAVNPTSVMGATKRMGEMIVNHYATTSKTVFTAVRFGNVLGSSGSVIPLFQRQITAGGPVTVTHPDIERYFMTIPEAARLVIQAGGMAQGGEIFILDMGDPVKIVDLAKSLIHLSGLVPNVDISIEFVGLRKGEKMFEELLMDEEDTLPTKHPSIMVSAGQGIEHTEIVDKLACLEASLEQSDARAIEVLESAVPNYTFTSNMGE